MLVLPNITLLGIDTTDDPGRTSRVLEYCQRSVQFGDAVLYSFVDLPRSDSYRLQHIESRGWEAVQDWEIEALSSAFSTDFVLCAQNDGWIENPECWRDEFLSHDYISAPWPNDWSGHRVGGSGFSLRSKRFTQACTRHAGEWNKSTLRHCDLWFCREMYDTFMAEGISYAPVEMAAKFSIESRCQETPEKSFGFHYFEAGRDRSEYLQKLVS